MTWVANMEEMILSIVIVTYNHEKYIRQALDSVLMQKMNFTYEILIGDDASADQTPYIIEEYAKKNTNITAIYRKENVGANYNAYDLLQRTKGRYIAFLDGDDYWTDEYKLQIQVDYMENHPQYSGCTHRFGIVDEEGNRKKNQKLSWVKFRKRFTLKEFDGVTLPGQASTLVRKNLFAYSDIDMSIIYKTHPLIGDRTSVLIYLCNGDFGGIDREMGCYRQVSKKTGQNATSKQYLANENKIMEEMDLLQKLEQIAYEMFHVKISTARRRDDLLCSALKEWLLSGDKRSFRYVTANRNKIVIIMKIPLIVIRKLLMLFRGW